MSGWCAGSGVECLPVASCIIIMCSQNVTNVLGCKLHFEPGSCFTIITLLHVANGTCVVETDLTYCNGGRLDCSPKPNRQFLSLSVWTKSMVTSRVAPKQPPEHNETTWSKRGYLILLYPLYITAAVMYITADESSSHHLPQNRKDNILLLTVWIK